MVAGPPTRAKIACLRKFSVVALQPEGKQWKDLLGILEEVIASYSPKCTRDGEVPGLVMRGEIYV